MAEFVWLPAPKLREYTGTRRTLAALGLSARGFLHRSTCGRKGAGVGNCRSLLILGLRPY
jgi:hypothetical protein